MPSGNQQARLSTLYTLLAGLQSGVLGGLFMLLVLSLAALRHGRTFWSASNLFATIFYGEDALRRGLRFSTLGGASLHILVSALFGIAFAFATQWLENRLYQRLLAIAVSLAWYAVCDGWLWDKFTPYLSLYNSRFDMIAGHLAFAYFLGSHQRYRRMIVMTLG